jgi:hypothetical protein
MTIMLYFFWKGKDMHTKSLTARVFFTAFRALPKDEQHSFLFTLVNHSSIREDLIDLAIAAKRNLEKCTGLHAFAKKLNKAK